MRRTSLLAVALPAAMAIGALLVPGAAWAGGCHHRHVRHVEYVSHACHHRVYHQATYYLSDVSYRRCEYPRYVRYYDDYAYRPCYRPHYARYDEDDYYARPCRPHRSHVAVYVNLGCLLGGHRYCR